MITEMTMNVLHWRLEARRNLGVIMYLGTATEILRSNKQ